MSFWVKYKLRLERKRYRARSMRKRRELNVMRRRTKSIAPDDILLFVTLRNEHPRLPFFLDYYRKLGVNHFFVVDNGSDDGGANYLAKQKDVSIWQTKASYKRARYGMDWINGLMSAYAVGHWSLVVDVDEFFVYPHSDQRPLRALTDWLDASRQRSFGALLLDMYPEGDYAKQKYKKGDNPLELSPFFDSGNYRVQRGKKYEELYIQGGVRERAMFADRPQYAPALNKVPLVKWSWSNVYVSSTHNLLPRGLNRVYDAKGGQQISGCLLHTKFMSTFSRKAKEELERKEHYADSREYREYAKSTSKERELVTDYSTRFDGWRQLEQLGLMSSGDWA